MTRDAEVGEGMKLLSSGNLASLREEPVTLEETKKSLSRFTALFNYASITFQLDSGKLQQGSLIGLKLEGSTKGEGWEEENMWLRGRTISFEGTPEVQTRAREVHNGRSRVLQGCGP